MSTLVNRRTARLIAAALLMLASAAAGAAPDDHPFARQHIALQISDADPAKQTLVLNVANNLLRHYGPDEVAIEVVAFGPGLGLLLADNANAERIGALVENGVRFSACSNTLRALTARLGHEPRLNAHAVRVEAGIVRLLELRQAGYTIVRP